jgi:hypothetical protein
MKNKLGNEINLASPAEERPIQAPLQEQIGPRLINGAVKNLARTR